MTATAFPLAPPEQLAVSRAHLTLLMHELAIELLERHEELFKARTPTELASTVRKISGQLSAASAGWAGLSETIRESWDI